MRKLVMQLLSARKSIRHAITRFLALEWVTKNLYFYYDETILVTNLRKTDSNKFLKTVVNLVDSSPANEFKYRHPETKVFPNHGYMVIQTSGESI